MAKVIEVPGQGMVEFPDEMTDEQIVAAIKKNSTTTPQTPTATTGGDPRITKIRTYADETDRLVGLTPGTSFGQLLAESNLDSNAKSKVGALGIAQVMDTTRQSLEKRLGRKLDPRNDDDALLMHREVMKENMAKFKDENDALKAYNGGWDKSRWNNPETANYVGRVRGKMGQDQAKPVVYKPFAPVRKDIDEASLDSDKDFIRASTLMYELFEQKTFEGTAKDAALYGKEGISAFNFNLVKMAEIAHKVATEGSQEQKEAFLYILDTYENTDVSWNGFKRAAWYSVLDPTNIVGLGTLGVATAGKFIGRGAAVNLAKETVAKSLATSFARTGIAAGIDTAVATAATEGGRQGIEVSAGRRQELDLSKIGWEGGKGFVAGAALGTAADLGITKTASKLMGIIRGKPTAELPARVEVPAQPTAEIPTFTVYRGVKDEGQKSSKGVLWASPDKKYAEKYGDSVGSYAIPVDAKTLDLTSLQSVEKEEAVFDLIAKQFGDDKTAEMMSQVKTNTAGYMDTYSIFRNRRAIELLREEGIDVVKFRQLSDGSDAVTVGIINKDLQKKSVEPKTIIEPNLGSTLTPQELAEAQARRQKGRLPEDSVVPEVPPGTPQLDVPMVNTGVRQTPVNMNQQGEQARVIVDQLRAVGTKELPAVMQQVRTGQYTLDQVQLLARGLSDYAKEVKVELAELIKKINATPNAPEVTQWLSRQAELEARDAAIMADDAVGSFSGSLQRQRQEGLQGVQGMTVESIMAEQGIPRKQAEQVYADRVGKAHLDAEAQRISREYDFKAQQAIEQGDLEGAARLATQKQREISALSDNQVPGSASLIQKATEAAISNVFSVKTVLINIVPSLAKTILIPGLKGILNDPFQKATRAEAAAAYSAMVSSIKPSFKAAVAAYRYEQAILTGGTSKVLEDRLAIEGLKGGIIRFFPRILNASDEFLSQINYASHVAGKAAAEAAFEGASKGLSGKELDTFIKEAASNAIDASLTSSPDDLVTPILNKGINLGLSGDALFKYVEKEAARNPDVFKKPTDEAAVDFVRDVLYKKQFSGTGYASGLAKGAEDFLAKYPSLKLVIGQLFFRTPIRVFEEGVRLTPGLQIIAPNFLTDLAGKNGALRQVRAQAEAMSSLAIAGTVLSLYAQGRITGDGAYSDWKQQRNRTDGPLQEPYTIRMSDGSTWSYRNFDPLATPVKIIINGLERMDRLAIREAQGELINKTEYQKALSYITVGSTAIASAIRDANLVAGFNGTIELAENLADPERKEGATMKWLGEKLFLLVPNTFHKMAKENDPTIKDPVTFLQMVDQKLALPFGQDEKLIKTSYSYDVLGNPRKLTDTGSLWNIFSTSSIEERSKGLSEESQVVLAEMDRLSRMTGTTFKPALKHREIGGWDLRTVMAEDGKRTLYDVWQDNYRALNPDKMLYPLAVSALPDGTYKHKGAKVDEMQGMMNDLQDIAFQQMKVQEQAVFDRFIQEVLSKAEAEAGLRDLK